MSYEYKINEQVVEIERLKPNPWNYNEQTDFMQEKLGNSLDRHGQVAEIIVRELPDGLLQIIDGEHRYKELVSKKTKKALVNNLGIISDDDAKLLTAVMNEIRGRRNPSKLSRLLKSLQESGDWMEIIEVLPYTAVELENILAIAADIPKESRAAKGDGGEDKPVSWVDIKVAVHQDVLDEVKALMVKAKKKLDIKSESHEALENGRLLKVLLGRGIGGIDETT